jgi:2-polyprenyl-3-methyl-5-hydroxy-6-metoxy-1,4-benzoquinol methylase
LHNVRWTHGDVLTYDSVIGYDAVVMIEAIEHISAWKVAIAAVSKLLHRSGALYLSTPNARGAYRKNDLHEKELTAAELRAGLSECFRDVKLYDYALKCEQDDDTVLTPLVAVCRKGSCG